nr:TPA_asm: hypothetical protein HUJ06_008785 [Nelumbo nucifera]
MNSNFGKPSNPQRGSVSSNNYEFDFGLGSGFSNNRHRSLNDHKQQNASPYSYPSSSSSTTTTTAWSSSTQPKQPSPSSSSWTPNKASWTHQSSPSTSNPTSMVGDIFGKSWASTARSGNNARIGIPEKNPNLFGDLVGSALGQAKSNTNVPLKNAAPPTASAQTKNSFSMGGMADSLPKTSTPMRNSNWGSSGNFGSYSAANNSTNTNSMNNSNKTGNLGGPAMRSGAGAPANSKKDPFGSLVDFGSKPNLNSTADNSSSAGAGASASDYSFGEFQNASKSNNQSFTSAFPATSNNYMGSNSSSAANLDNFGIPTTQDFASQKQPPTQPTSVDPLDMLFSSTSNSTSAAPTTAPEVSGNEPFSEADDWGLGAEFGGSDVGGTTELEGLPPPPAGVTASAAKNKGLDNHKQGQFADAIKWLSWAVVLLEKAGDDAASVEVLSCRASCYKEVGEYKKAIADCSKV